MELRVIDSATIREMAQIEELICWMREAMIVTSKRDSVLPLRRALELPGDYGAIGMMPGFLGGDFASAGVKLVSLVPPHRRKGSSHLGLMVLYDADGLLPIALMCGATVTAIRTSAMTAAATDALAREDSASLTILGAGEQAHAHAHALRKVRNFKRMRVWSYDKAEAEDFARRLRDDHGLLFEPCDYVETAVEGADVICTVTSAPSPILFGDMVASGAHVNLVGSSHKDAAEADIELVRRSKFFVDYKPSTMDQAGEFLNALEAGIVSEDHIVAEIGEVLSGATKGRTKNQEITVYKSLGVAAQDIATAHKIYHATCRHNKGICVNL